MQNAINISSSRVENLVHTSLGTCDHKHCLRFIIESRFAFNRMVMSTMAPPSRAGTLFHRALNLNFCPLQILRKPKDNVKIWRLPARHRTEGSEIALLIIDPFVRATRRAENTGNKKSPSSVNIQRHTLNYAIFLNAVVKTALRPLLLNRGARHFINLNLNCLGTNYSYRRHWVIDLFLCLSYSSS